MTIDGDRRFASKFEAIAAIAILEAALLVVLVQVSSACVERVFSQLKLIFQAVQSQGLHDMTELRVFERVNRNRYLFGLDPIE